MHIEADQFFTNSAGAYIFDSAKVRDAHAWCQKSCKEALAAGKSVVVSNTFVKKWEMVPYETMARELGVPLRVLVAVGAWGNEHGVTEEKMELMKRNWQP